MRALRPVIAGLEALGHPAEQLARDAGIAPADLSDADGHLAPGVMAKFWDLAVTTTHDDRLGMHLAMATPLPAFDLHAYAMASSPTLRDAYHRACRYQSLLNEATELTFTETRTGGMLRHGLPGGRSVSRQPAEFLVTAWVRIGRLVTGSAWQPARVFFAHDQPADTSEYAAVFGAPVQFSSGQTALEIPPDVLALKNPRADPTLLVLLDRYTSTLLERHQPLTTVSARLRAWLVEGHGAGTAAAPQAAKALAMSERTLHRHLEQEGTTFRKLVDQFRHEKAVELLTSRRHSIAEVAFLLGYSELSAFYRAFRRWTGQAPAELRTKVG